MWSDAVNIPKTQSKAVTENATRSITLLPKNEIEVVIGNGNQKQ